ncbi:MAG TPA: cytochrome P450 [Solirubrobacterales bacterium]|nr:cytochrome P450 [Solirubrobacterales bacterium]
MPLPPGPSESALAQTLRWTLRPLAFVKECRERYGDTFSLRLIGFKHLVLISDPAAIKALYLESENEMSAGRKMLLRPLLGAESVFLLEGNEHLARRKLMLPPFHGERMRSYEAVVEEIVTAEIDSWPIGQEFPIHTGMQAVTLEVILRVVFGLADGPRLERLRDLLPEVLTETGSPRALMLGLLASRFGEGGPWARLEGKLMKEVDGLLFAEIAEHRARPDLAEREDILSMLMLARFEDGSAMSDKDLRDQLMTLLLAGHETTATALAWTFDLLLRHPPQLQRLRESLAAGENDYLKATMSESLRLRPVVPLIGRRLAKELSVDGLTLPAGTNVAPAVWITHTRADLYPDPAAFKPERFLDEAPDAYAWIPFGGGIHRCIGVAFAELEMRIVLREVLGRCDLRKTSPLAEIGARRNLTLSPKDGTPVIVDARRPPRETPVAA